MLILYKFTPRNMENAAHHGEHHYMHDVLAKIWIFVEACDTFQEQESSH